MRGKCFICGPYDTILEPYFSRSKAACEHSGLKTKCLRAVFLLYIPNCEQTPFLSWKTAVP